jgi:hypothetical protein
MMNDPFVHEQARHFAARLIDADPSAAARIRLAYRLALARPPTADEVRSGEAYLLSADAAFTAAGVPAAEGPPAAWASYARVLMSSNEFIFID